MLRSRPLAPAPLLALTAALLPPLLGALLASCGEESAPAPAPSPDAGTSCESGTQGCACGESNACYDGLLCNSGRCLPTEGSREQEPAFRPPVQLPCSPLPCDLEPGDTGPSSSS